MPYANESEKENNPSLNQKVFGFDETGKDVTMPLSAIYDLFGKAASGITNKYVLSESTLAEGSFLTDSLLFDEITEITFNNVDSYGTSMVSYFELLNTNKLDLFLKIQKLGFETVGYYRITNVVFGEDTLTVTVSLHNNLKLGSLILGDNIYIEPILEKVFGIKSNESLVLAQRKDDDLFGIIDQYTGEQITLSKVTGTPTVDGVIYFQLGSEYFKRNYKKVAPQMFGAKADGTTNDTTAIQNAINFCQTNNEVLEIIGDFACNTITISNNLELETNCNLQILTDVDGIVLTGRSTGYGDANVTKLKHTGVLNIRGFASNSLKRGIVLKNGTLYSSFDKVFISNFGLGVDYEASGNNNIVAWNLLDVRDCSNGAATTFTKGTFVSPNTIFNIGEITTPAPILTNMGTVLILQPTDGSDYRAYPIVAKPDSVNTYYIGNFDQLPSSGTLVYYTGGGVHHRKHTDNGAIEYKTLRLGGIAGASLTIQSFYGVTVNGGQIEGCYSNVIVGGIYMNGVNPETIYTIRCLFQGLHTEVNDANNPLIYSLKKSMIAFEGCIIPQPYVAAPETGVKYYDPSGSDRNSNVYYGKPTSTFPIIEPIDPTFKVYNDVSSYTDILFLDLRDLLSGMSYVGDSRIKHIAVGEYNLLNIPVGETRTLRVRPFGFNTVNGGTSSIDIEVTGIEGKSEYKITFLLVEKNFTYTLDESVKELTDVVNALVDLDTKLSFVDVAAATAYWTAAVTKPVDGKELYISSLNDFYKWASAETAKVLFSRDNFKVATEITENNPDLATAGQVFDEIAEVDKKISEQTRLNYFPDPNWQTNNFLLSVSESTGFNGGGVVLADITNNNDGSISFSKAIQYRFRISQIPFFPSDNRKTGVKFMFKSTIAGNYRIQLRNNFTGQVYQDTTFVLLANTNVFINLFGNFVEPTITGFDINFVNFPVGFVGTIGKMMLDLGVDQNSNYDYLSETFASKNELDLKAPLASPTFTGTVGGITKTMVGLGNVDNTSDANKPISTAQQTALNAVKTEVDEKIANQTRLNYFPDPNWQTNNFLLSVSESTGFNGGGVVLADITNNNDGTISFIKAAQYRFKKTQLPNFPDGNRKVGVKFLMKSTITGNYRIQLRNNFTSQIGADVIFPLVANTYSFINLYGNFAQDTINGFDLNFVSFPSGFVATWGKMMLDLGVDQNTNYNYLGETFVSKDDLSTEVSLLDAEILNVANSNYTFTNMIRYPEMEVNEFTSVITSQSWLTTSFSAGSLKFAINNYTTGFATIQSVNLLQGRPNERFVVYTKWKVLSENFDAIGKGGNQTAGFRIALSRSGQNDIVEFMATTRAGQEEYQARILTLPALAPDSPQYGLQISTYLPLLENIGLDFEFEITKIGMVRIGLESENPVVWNWTEEDWKAYIQGQESLEWDKEYKVAQHAFTANRVFGNYDGKTLGCYSASVGETLTWQPEVARLKGMIFDKTLALDGDGVHAETTLGGSWVTACANSLSGVNGIGKSQYARFKDSYSTYKFDVLIFLAGYNEKAAGQPYITGGTAVVPADYGLSDVISENFYTGVEVDLTVDPTLPVPSFGASLLGMIKHAYDVNPYVEIRICTLYSALGAEPVSTGLNAVIRKIGEKFSIPIVDFEKNSGINKWNYQKILKDSIHPGRIAGERMTNALLMTF